MTQDLWHLDKWVSCGCILDPTPRSRCIMINGYIREDQYVSYRVVFKNKLELAAFILKYSDRCDPMKFSSVNEQKKVWKYLVSKYERRRYSQGPAV